MKIDYFVCAMNVEIYYVLKLQYQTPIKKLDRKLDFGPLGCYPVLIEARAFRYWL